MRFKILLSIVGLIALFSTGSRRPQHPRLQPQPRPLQQLSDRECLKTDAQIRRRLPLFEEIVCRRDSLGGLWKT